MFKKHKLLSLILLLTVLLALAAVAFFLIPDKTSGKSVLSEMFNRSLPKVTVNELNFTVGRNRVFAYSRTDGTVAATGTLGLQVLGPDGKETLSDSYRAVSPALSEKNGRFIAYDIGGTSFRIFSANEMLSAFETEGRIVSASVNKNSWFCVVTQEQAGGHRGTIDVYNSSGTRVFNVTIGSSFVLSAVLSDDNNNLVILGIAQSGSVLTVYNGIDTHKDEPDQIISLGPEVFVETEFLTNTKLLAIGEKSVFTIDISNSDPIQELYYFGSKRLGDYTYSDRFIALLLYDYSIGYGGQILTLDFDGTVLAQLETTGEIASIDSCDDTLVVLDNDGISFYDKYLSAHPLPAAAHTSTIAARVITLGDDMALGANDLSAFVIRRDAD